MKESGEQCNDVFALTITERASECVCVWWGGGVGDAIPTASSATIYAKTTLHCSPYSSMGQTHLALFGTKFVQVCTQILSYKRRLSWYNNFGVFYSAFQIKILF
jgi:hypothetical protein